MKRTLVDITSDYLYFNGPNPWISLDGATWISYDYQIEKPSENSWCVFSKQFEIPGEVIAASIEITADNAYRLFVNGGFIGEERARYNFLISNSLWEKMLYLFWHK